MRNIFRIAEWLPRRSKKYLIQDLISSLTVTPFVIPQGLAYGTLAGLSPQYGLYTSLVPPLIFAVFGQSPHINIGVFAVISILVKSGVDGVLTSLGADLTNDQIMDARVQIVMCITLFVGVLGFLLSLLGLGAKMIKFMNQNMINSLTCAASFHIATSQFKEFFGIRHFYEHTNVIESALGLKSSTVFGLGVQWATIIRAFAQGDFHVPTTIMGLSVLIAVVLFKFGDKKLKAWAVKQSDEDYQHLPVDAEHLIESDQSQRQRKQSLSKRVAEFPFPEVFIVIMLCIIIVYAGRLYQDPVNIKIVGFIPSGIPPLTLPWNMDKVCSLLTDCSLQIIYVSLIVPSLVLFVASFLLASSIILYYQENGVTETELDLNQDWFALSLCSLVGSFCSSFVPSGSLSRTAIVNNSYKNVPPSQLLAIISVIMIVIVLYTLTGVLSFIPYCALSAIILESLRNIFGQLRKGVSLIRENFKSVDTFIWWLTFLSIVFVNLEYGLIIGFSLSALSVLFQKFFTQRTFEQVNEEDVFEEKGESVTKEQISVLYNDINKN